MHDIDNQMLNVVSRFCDDFSDQVTALVACVPDSDERYTFSDYDHDLRHLHAETHRLCGAAHCMGFLKVGRELERFDREVTGLIGNGKERIERTLPALKRRLEAIRTEYAWISPARSKLLNRSSALEELERAEGDQELMRSSEMARQRLLSRERILFADDDLYVRELINMTLIEIGVGDIVTVGSGRELLDSLSDFQPTLIISDCQMAPISGLEVLKRIRAGQTAIDEQTPVIFFTAERDRRKASEANKNGISELLYKPLLPSEVTDAVLHVIGRRFYMNKSAALRRSRH